MELAEQAVTMRIHGNIGQVPELLEQAFALEKEAASMCGMDLEPSRSVLYRSAASLALQCKQLREAEQMIAAGLAGNPHEDIADELRDLMEQVWFERHLQTRGMALDSREIQMTLAGKAVGYGMIVSEEFLSRAHAFEKMITRTGQRKLGVPYQEHAGPKKRVRELFEVCYAVPKAASFSIGIRLGKPDSQGTLFQDQRGEFDVIDVVDEVIDALSHMNEGKTKEVLERIEDDAYRRNFFALARKVAPDGVNIRLVGLSIIRNQELKRVQITHPFEKIARQTDVQSNGQPIVVVGDLRFADDRPAQKNSQIRVVPDDAPDQPFVVPEGMMDDIVRPLWGKRVVVEGYKKGKVAHLEDIRVAAEEDSVAPSPDGP
jgi:hypothetical protein